ncbi:MAG TPA: hypothetical protein VGM93_13860 [Acidimicrobiales bacterium]
MEINTLSKVPKITAWFWVVKLLTTAMGESTSDYLVNRFSPALMVILSLLVLIAVLAVQFRTPRYVAWSYWLAALMVSVFGTMAADAAHVGLGIPYAFSTALCALALVAVFVVWHRSEQTLSIHSINSTRREAFYWCTALVTFALGTAAGDLVAISFHLGFLSAGVLFGVVFLVPALGYRFLKLDAIFTFWFAYIVTRPLGASFADWFARAPSARGLGHGDGPVSLLLGVLIAAAVTYLSITHADDPNTGIAAGSQPAQPHASSPPSEHGATPLPP